MTNSFDTITLSVDGHLAVLTFNRPDVLNALNTTVLAEALQAVRQIGADPAARVMVLTGAGRAFVAGADISEMRGKGPAQARAYSEQGHELMRALEELDKPVIAAVNGFALGGGMELALACDIRIASEEALFGLPEATLGLIPGWGGTQRLSRLVSPALAREIIFTADRISARRAAEIGLANRVVPHACLMQFTLDLARRICKQGPVALGCAKKAIRDGMKVTLAQGCAIETDEFVTCFDTQDCREGISAFLEKRKPSFNGH